MYGFAGQLFGGRIVKVSFFRLQLPEESHDFVQSRLSLGNHGGTHMENVPQSFPYLKGDLISGSYCFFGQVQRIAEKNIVACAMDQQGRKTGQAAEERGNFGILRIPALYIMCGNEKFRMTAIRICFSTGSVGFARAAEIQGRADEDQSAGRRDGRSF